MKIKITRAFLAFLLASGIQLSLTTCTKSGNIYENRVDEEITSDFTSKH